MLNVTQRAEGTPKPTKTLTLPYDRRQKSRQRAALDDGTEVAIELERGSSLRDGDRLVADSGDVIQVHAADESVSVVASSDPLQLARAAYHLGNRHVALQIREGELRYQHDHVLDDMVRKLGLDVRHAMLSFEPESGAYGSGHSHLGGHGHGHSHGHGHQH